MDNQARLLSQLVPGTLVLQHLKTCKLETSDCGLCAVHEAWKSYKRDWVRAILNDGVVTLGCSTCCKAGLDGPWANFQQKPGAILRKFCLDRHEKSRGHQAASKSLSTDKALHLAPSQESFEELLTQTLQGQSVRAGGVTSDKRIKMRWALTEAILARNRHMLKDCQSMTLLRDERKGKLLVRFRAVLRDLSTVSGCLGLTPVSGSSDSIALATDALMEAFCVPMRQPPRASCVAEGSVDQALLQHLRQTVTIIVTDAAASEQLATDLQRGPKRACSELKSIMHEWRHGSDSFAQKVQHSPVLAQWWAAALESPTSEECDFGSLTSLSAAKHRFSSYLNPLSRICKNMQTVFKVCCRLQAMRGSEAGWAIQLCRNFSGFKAVLLTMAADACAISNDYTRECDQEGTDIAQLNLRAHQFISSARALFVERQVCTLPSFTKDFLSRKEPVLVQLDGFVLEVRATPADVEKAFQVMQDLLFGLHSQDSKHFFHWLIQFYLIVLRFELVSVLQEWTALAEEVVAHEIPSWHLFAAFEVFHLPDSKESRKLNGEDLERNLQRLAQAFHVSTDQLKREFTQMQPIAAALKKSASHSNREAWRQAVLRVGRRSPAQANTTGALRTVLASYLAWTASSSGVEQLFSTLKASPTEQSKSSGAVLDTDRRTAVAMGDCQVREAKVAAEIVSEARRLYCTLLRSGISRTNTQQRFDKGRTSTTGRKGSHAQWDRDRKESLATALKDLTTPPRAATAPMRTESAVKERDLQRSKAFKRKAEALTDGLLLPDEVTPALECAAKKMVKNNKQNDRQRKKKRLDYLTEYEMASTKKPSGWACDGLQGPVWLDPRLGEKTQAVQQKLHTLGVTSQSQDMQQAKLLVLANFGQVGDSVKITAALQGAVVLSAAVLFGKGGVKLTFNGGLCIEAAVSVTQEFKVEQPDLTALLRVACANGWLAVKMNDLKGRGRKPSLLLRGKDEVVQGFGRTR
ncbi:Uncharacterized protein SCF082_LOCUS52631, partial [Durusdinium trenchii]